MKNVAKEVKLVHTRTRIALPEAELRNREKRTQTLGLQPAQKDGKTIHKAEAPLLFQPKF